MKRSNTPYTRDWFIPTKTTSILFVVITILSLVFTGFVESPAYARDITLSLSNAESGCTDLFGPATNYDVGLNPYAIVTGDFTGDSKIDIVVANEGSGTVSVLPGKGDVTFQSPINSPGGSNANSLAKGDFNGDGKLDLAIANHHTSNLTILLGNGDGTFQAPVNYTVGLDAGHVVAIDLNGDGKLDLVVTSEAVNYLSILLGKGDGTFQPGTNVFVNVFNPVYTTVADFNGDGKLDLAVTFDTVSTTSTVSILLGNGNATFQSPVNYTVGPRPFAVVAGDFNKDGNLDLVTSNSAWQLPGVDSTVSVLIGNGNGTFQPAVTYLANSTGGRMTVGDVDGDGNIDLITAGGFTNSVGIMLGNGNGTFQPPLSYAVGIRPSYVAAADFNLDGHLDIVASNEDTANISVLTRMQCQPTLPPTISKAFGAVSIPLNGTTSLSFTITNPNSQASLSGIAFTDTMPAGLQVADVPAVSNNCSGTIEATAGGGFIKLTGGKLDANKTCIIKVDVKGITAGEKSNTTGPISATESGSGNPSNTAILTVNAPITGRVAQLRFAHLAPVTANVDIYVNRILVLKGVTFGTVSPYLPFKPGNYAIDIIKAGSNLDTTDPLISEAVDLENKASYTYSVLNFNDDPGANSYFYQDNLKAPASGKAKLKVLHASPNAEAVDVAIQGGRVLFRGLNNGESTEYLQLPAGNYNLEVREAGTRHVLYTIPIINLQVGKIYTAIAEGLVGGSPAFNVKLITDK